MMKWISVKDRLPEEDISVMAYVPSLKRILLLYYLKSGHVEQEGWSQEQFLEDGWHAHPFSFQVTHWMSLPETPKTKEKI